MADNEKFKCKKCNRQFTTTHTITRHLNKKIPCDSEGKQNYSINKRKCKKCNKILSTTTVLKDHEGRCKKNNNAVPYINNNTNSKKEFIEIPKENNIDCINKTVEVMQKEIELCKKEMIIHKKQVELQNKIIEIHKQEFLVENNKLRGKKYKNNIIPVNISNAQYIYLIQEREFINSKKNIYKIGKTKQSNNKRFQQYPKGSILLLQLICEDCTAIENKLINLFKTKYTQCKDIGTEYFEGDKADMINTIYINTLIASM
jgi:hypothetical protein